MPPPRMTTQAQRDKEEEAAQKLLDRAPDVLKAVESSYIFTNPKRRQGHRPNTIITKSDPAVNTSTTSSDDSSAVSCRNGKRIVPRFRPEELSLGSWLGTGGFAIVHEIKGICLDKPVNDDPPPLVTATDKGSQDNAGGSAAPASDQESNTEASVVMNGGDSSGAQVVPQLIGMDGRVLSEEALRLQQDQRESMERRALRKGAGRYAIKRLHNNLTTLERARGRIDLAVEAKYLSAVHHPNIVKLRGVASGDPLKPGYFLILDRLYGTLDQRMNEWRRKQKECNGGFLGLGKKKSMLKELMVDRMTVAYDLAAAFFYLHENRIVYRDIKPENVGFDVRGDCKVFDLGLCKSLTPELKAKDGGYGYRLTGRAGSLPYMAVEVIKMETYDTKCDCYSFAILLWEILCLQQAFKGLSPKEFVERVVVRKERPPMPKDKGAIPHLTRLMLPEAWDPDPRRRPDMKRMAILIRGDLNDLTSDENVLNRTKHMDDRSVDSMDLNDDDHDGGPSSGPTKK